MQTVTHARCPLLIWVLSLTPLWLAKRPLQRELALPLQTSHFAADQDCPSPYSVASVGPQLLLPAIQSLLSAMSRYTY